MRSINLTIEDKKYTLAYNLKTIKIMAQNGFDVQKISENSIATLIDLIEYAFYVHHPELTEDEIFKIISKIKGKKKLYPILSEMFTQAFNDLVDEDKDDEDGESKNLNWGIIDK